jgi:lysophospholipase L1-like esterase
MNAQTSTSQSIPPQSRQKRVIFWLILLGLPIVVPCCLLEAGLRLTAPEGFWATLGWGERNYVADDALIWRPREPLYFWDDQEHPPTPAKPPGVKRLFALGDSFTKAHGDIGQENSFYYVMARRLQEFPEATYELFHFGVSGYSEIQFLELTRRYGPQYQPDLIIVQVYLGNDIGENSGLIVRWLGDQGERLEQYQEVRPTPATTTTVAPTATPVPTIVPQAAASWRDFLVTHSYAVRWLREGVGTLRWRLQGIPPPGPGGAGDPLAGISHSPHILNLMASQTPPEIEKAWQITADLTQQIKVEADAVGAKLLFVLVPHELQVNDQDWQMVVSEFHLVETAYDRDLPSRRFREILEQTEISYLDLTPEFRQRIQAGETLYIGHFSKEGHAVVGEAIYEKLREVDKIR